MLVTELGLHQHVLNPTRYRNGQEPSTLDLVFTRYEQDLDTICFYEPLGHSDHVVIGANLGISSAGEQMIMKRNFGRIDEEQLTTSALQYNWEIGVFSSLEEKWLHIKHNFISVTDLVAPLSHFRRKKKPWIKSRALRALRKKRNAWNKYKVMGSHENWRRYSRSREIAARTLKSCREQYEERLAARAKWNPKAYYKCVQHKKSLRKTISLLKTDNGIVEDSEGKANLLMEHFQGVHRKDGGLPVPTLGIDFSSVTDMTCSEIEGRKVSKSLSYLRVDKSAGPDGIHPAIVKPLAPLIIQPLTELFNKSLHDGEIPMDWRQACVVAVHKGGAKDLVKQYRPVSLTSIILKTMERIIRDRVAEHLTENDLLCPQQHGFIRRRSCMTNLITFLDAVTEALDQGKKVAVCYFDFSKAFDSVNHRFLLHKLQCYKVAPSICDWISAFLKDRIFQVKVGDVLSGKALACSGVPQGSVLGSVFGSELIPLCFSLALLFKSKYFA